MCRYISVTYSWGWCFTELSALRYSAGSSTYSGQDGVIREGGRGKTEENNNGGMSAVLNEEP